jgi:hypothetical protein
MIRVPGSFPENKKKAVGGETGRGAGSCAKKDTGYHYNGITGFFGESIGFFIILPLFRHSLDHEGA